MRPHLPSAVHGALAQEKLAGGDVWEGGGGAWSRMDHSSHTIHPEGSRAQEEEAGGPDMLGILKKKAKEARCSGTVG